jgi:small subunit ribosomal protein S14
MAKKSSLLRELKRQKLVKKFLKKRILFLNIIKKTNSIEKRREIYKKLEELPKNSIPIRLRNRCWKTGKSRGYIRFFGLCRNVLRELTHECLLPGIIKSSW